LEGLVGVGDQQMGRYSWIVIWEEELGITERFERRNNDEEEGRLDEIERWWRFLEWTVKWEGLRIGSWNGVKWWSALSLRMRSWTVEVIYDMRRIKFVKRLLRYARIHQGGKSGGLITKGWMIRETILDCYICCWWVLFVQDDDNLELRLIDDWKWREIEIRLTRWIIFGNKIQKEIKRKKKSSVLCVGDHARDGPPVSG
jgi:hypothetical protein